MMLRAQSCACTVVKGFGDARHRANAPRSIPSSVFYASSVHVSCRLIARGEFRGRSNSVLIECRTSSGGNSIYGNHQGDDDDYVEAIVLVSETLKHYQMRTQGSQEEIKWQSPVHLLPLSIRGKDPRVNVNAIGPGILRRYRNPTIFLKISCDGDFLLPIVVGEFAVEKLINSPQEVDSGDCPNQYQFVINISQKLGYEVKMIRITERRDNIYFASIFFHKPGEKDFLRIDARPSDAINVAERCGAPVFVNKQIVLTDAVRIAYGMGRLPNTKSGYDITLDSATDGPDLISEELGMVQNMNLAIKEERYNDAALWRDKLLKLRQSGGKL